MPPTVGGVVGGLTEAVAASRDYPARATASRVHWSTSWSQSFPDELLDRIGRALWSS